MNNKKLKSHALNFTISKLLRINDHFNCHRFTDSQIKEKRKQNFQNEYIDKILFGSLDKIKKRNL